MPEPVRLSEYVEIGGIEQFLFHAGDDASNPVMLHLHGGPGMPFSNRAWEVSRWTPYVTTVFWDQRGAGKTALRNPNAAPTFASMQGDIHEIVHYLKSRYGKTRIGLLGHSWGSVIGSLYAMEHPEDLTFYVGVGQVVNAIEDERIGAAELRRRAIEAGAADDIAQLDALGDYPGPPDGVLAKLLVARELQSKYGLASIDPERDAEMAARSPLFTDADLTARDISVPLLEQLYREFADFNLFDIGHDYDVPIHYLLGADDWQVPAVQGVRYFEDIRAPHKELHLIDGACHRPMIEQPQAFSDLLRPICARTAG